MLESVKKVGGWDQPVRSVRGKKKRLENARDTHCVYAEKIISADAAQEIREMRARDIDGGGRAAKMTE
jgi:hypothetical protein